MLSASFWHDSVNLYSIKPLITTIMGKKLWALALVGAAAYLFKTEKGAEIRKNLGKSAGDWKTKLTDAYNNRSTKPLEV